jgi:hypothetical protein
MRRRGSTIHEVVLSSWAGTALQKLLTEAVDHAES